jgi:O-antigen ligase
MPPRPYAGPDPDSDVLLKLAFWFFLVDLFLTMSKLLEIVSISGNTRVPYLGVTIHFATFGLAVVSGGARRVLDTRIGICLALFTSWMMVCTVLSTWRGGSVDTLLHEWVPTFVIFCGCGTVATLSQCRKTTAVLAAGTTIIAGASYLLASVKQDRLAFEGGTLGNSNDLSLLLVFGLPFLLAPVLWKGSSNFRKLLVMALGVMVLVVVVRSASRGSLVALGTILLILFWTQTFAGKVKLGLLTVVMVTAFFALTPKEILSRYVTIFGDAEQSDDVAASAEYSSIARRELLQQSLKLTVAHPLFGVGPGIFVVGAAQMSSAEGQRPMWHVSHNTYTQVSSETGIPGLLLYLGALWATFRNVFWFRTHSRIDRTGSVSAMGLAFLLSLAGLCVGLTFSSSAYLPYMPILMGLSVVFRKSLERDIDLHARSLVLSVPEPPMPTLVKPAASTSSHKPVYRFLGRPARRSGA